MGEITSRLLCSASDQSFGLLADNGLMIYAGLFGDLRLLRKRGVVNGPAWIAQAQGHPLNTECR